MQDIREHILERESESKFFFLNPSGKTLSRKSIYDIVLKVVEGAKVHIDEKPGWVKLITPHSFRRVFATRLYLYRD